MTKDKEGFYMAEKSLFSRLSLLFAGLSFFVIPVVFGIIGTISGIIGLLRQEEQKSFAVIGMIICIIRVIVALAVNGNL